MPADIQTVNTAEERLSSLYPTWMRLLFPDPRRRLQQLIIQHSLQTGLDVGCGTFSLISQARSNTFHTTGLDIFLPSIEASKQQGLHDSYVLADFLDHSFPEPFDVVCLSHVIEHFDREQASEVLRKAEELSKRIVYIETPNGFLEQAAIKDNDAQRHLSGWFPYDFESRGYTVFGIGSKWLRGSVGRPRFLGASGVRLVENFTKWHRYRRPRGAFVIAAIKYVDANGNVTGV